MAWVIGKIVGATVGLFAAGPVGAAVGLALGHALDHITKPQDPDEALKRLRELREPTPTAEDIDRDARQRFARSLLGLFIAVARVEGGVRREEVRIIKGFFRRQLGLTGEELDAMRELLKRSLLDEPVDVVAASRKYKEESTAEERLLFIQALYDMASFEGDLSAAEQRMINQIVVELDLSESDHSTIRGIFISAPSIEEDYQLLGLKPGLDDAALKKGYRVLAATHHPDKVAQLGPEAVTMAQRRFAEIKAAYDRIRAARGL